MYFQESDREKFAELIVDAVGLAGTDDGKKFIKYFTDKLSVSGSIMWRDKVIEWIKDKKENRDVVKNSIRKNPEDASAVLKLIESNLRHY